METRPGAGGAACQGQRGVLPQSLEVSRSVVGQGLREASSAAVSYTVRTADTTVDLQLSPGLPATPTTAEVRDQLQVALAIIDLEQPPDIGGKLRITQPLSLANFDQLEIQAGALQLRLAFDSGTTYEKWLSSTDADPTNDPASARDCFMADGVDGQCVCSFSGPSIQVTIEGTASL